MARLLIALLLLASAAVAQDRPNPDLTPGAVRPLTLGTVCTTRWGVDRRHVTTAMRRHVFAAYGIPWERRADYELDHLVPRSLAGADDILNLFPQPWPSARKKDRLEVALGKRVCAGTMTLPQAQRAFRTDWMAAYQQQFGEAP